VLFEHTGDELICHETGGDAEQALRVLGHFGRKRHCRRVVFPSLPQDSDLAKRLRGGTCDVESWYVRDGGAMAQVLNLPATLRAVAPELSSRLRGSRLADWAGTLRLQDKREAVGLDIARGKVRIVDPGKTRHSIRAGHEVAQLILGTNAPAETAEAGKMKLTGDADKLLEALFPAQRPMLRSMDRF